MTTPPCPRCGRPCITGIDRTRCISDMCGYSYGHDAPRSLIPQPDPVGVAPINRKLADDLATGNSLYGAAARRSTITWRDHMAEHMMACGWVHRAQPAPTPQRTDPVGVAEACEVCWHNAWVPTEDGLRCDYCWLNERYMSLAANHVADAMAAQPAPAPAANATPPAVDEGMRERVMRRFDEVIDWEPRYAADAIISAILASHEIVRRGDAPAPARVSAGLSAGARETILNALAICASCDIRCPSVPKYAQIESARAEIEALP